MKIRQLLTSYLGKEPQYKLANEINDAMRYPYISAVSISHWINGVHLPTLKTARTIRRGASKGSKLWKLFDEIVKELEETVVHV